jgi:hypothetical protein
MHFMDPKSTQGIKDVLSSATKAKFARTQPEKIAPPAKILPVRGIAQPKAKPPAKALKSLKDTD